MIEVFEYWYDTVSGRIYDPEGNPQPFTFDTACIAAGRNPQQFASEETAEKMVIFVRPIAAFLGFRVSKQNGGLTGWQIVVTDKEGNNSFHNAGLIANTIMRSGPRQAQELLRVEIPREHGLTGAF